METCRYEEADLLHVNAPLGSWLSVHRAGGTPGERRPLGL